MSISRDIFDARPARLSPCGGDQRRRVAFCLRSPPFVSTSDDCRGARPALVTPMATARMHSSVAHVVSPHLSGVVIPGVHRTNSPRSSRGTRIFLAHFGARPLKECTSAPARNPEIFSMRVSWGRSNLNDAARLQRARPSVSTKVNRAR